MKVFKFYCGVIHYGIAAKTQKEAIEFFEEETGDQYTICEEIPESDWDKNEINIWEDNDTEKTPFKTSIRESICGKEPQMIFSNNFTYF